MPYVVGQGLRAKADDKDFQAKWRAIKYQNKERLAAKIKVLAPICTCACSSARQPGHSSYSRRGDDSA